MPEELDYIQEAINSLNGCVTVLFDAYRDEDSQTAYFALQAAAEYIVGLRDYFGKSATNEVKLSVTPEYVLEAVDGPDDDPFEIQDMTGNYL